MKKHFDGFELETVHERTNELELLDADGRAADGRATRGTMLRRAASGTLASTNSTTRDVLSVLYRRMMSSVHATTTTTPSIERWSAELMEVRRMMNECVR